ncbi:MAG: hypothetical protein HYY66_04065 [Candidatus Tectomicrobia bacterium]|nr:hypothetical protein [Candidatus Tectomicrobia bacterium]MBI3024849.1 hypothetical protein [Candidatus Tectomicrobia bacterium]
MTRHSPAAGMAWRRPKCGRICRGPVFEACTAMSGPMCDTCVLPLFWAAVETGRAVIGKQEWLRMEDEEEARAESLEDGEE